jgi:hypothetical protein
MNELLSLRLLRRYSYSFTIIGKNTLSDDSVTPSKKMGDSLTVSLICPGASTNSTTGSVWPACVIK